MSETCTFSLVNHDTPLCSPIFQRVLFFDFQKPGLVCLEGSLEECNDVWSVIKQWTWKKINVKFQEEENLNNMAELKLWRKFDKFEEIGFLKGETRDYHMDMGEFYKFLQTHHCDYMFKELFGIDKS